jgi:hypothetical protein
VWGYTKHGDAHITVTPATDYPRASRSFPRIAGSGNEIDFSMEEHGLTPGWLYVSVISALSFKVVNKSVVLVLPPPQKFRDQWRKVWLWESICTALVYSFLSAALSLYRYISLYLIYIQ